MAVISDFLRYLLSKGIEMVFLVPDPRFLLCICVISMVSLSLSLSRTHGSLCTEWLFCYSCRESSRDRDRRSREVNTDADVHSSLKKKSVCIFVLYLLSLNGSLSIIAIPGDSCPRTRGGLVQGNLALSGLLSEFRLPSNSLGSPWPNSIVGSYLVIFPRLFSACTCVLGGNCLHSRLPATHPLFLLSFTAEVLSYAGLIREVISGYVKWGGKPRESAVILWGSLTRNLQKLCTNQPVKVLLA